MVRCILVSLLVACGSLLAAAEGSRGATLSEASRSAADDGDGVVDRDDDHDDHDDHDGHRIRHHHDDHHHHHHHGVAAAAAAPAMAGPHGDDGADIVAAGGYAHQAYEGGFRVEVEHRIEAIGIQGRSGHFGLRLGIGFSLLDFDRDHGGTVGLEDGWGLHIDGSLRGHLLSSHLDPLIDPYLEVAMRGKQWFWDFRNPIRDGDDEIERDGIGGMDLGLGVGAVTTLDHLVLDAGLEGGFSVFDGVSNEGFHNDLFDSAWYWVAAVRVGYRF